jgi:hypothetical protein
MGEKNMFDMFELLISTLWTVLVVYATWYFTSAKHYAPLTSKEARMLWRIHKRSIRCTATKWREIRRAGKIIGFECECGYKHTQKRPIVSNTPATNVHSQNHVFDKLHTSY